MEHAETNASPDAGGWVGGHNEREADRHAQTGGGHAVTLSMDEMDGDQHAAQTACRRQCSNHSVIT